MTARNVYVVEDEEPIRRSSQMMLKLMGCEAHTFESGVPFLEQAEALASGCVLLDIRMPELDGLEVQRRLNAAGSNHSVIVMSGHGDLGVAVPAMEGGAVSFLEKPFSRATLQQALDIGFLKLEEPAGYEDYLQAAADAVQNLDEADRQVLALLIDGHRAEAIAEEMGDSKATIEISMSRIFTQLGVDSMIDALRLSFAAEQIERR